MRPRSTVATASREHGSATSHIWLYYKPYMCAMYGSLNKHSKILVRLLEDCNEIVKPIPRYRFGYSKTYTQTYTQPCVARCTNDYTNEYGAANG